MASFSLHTHTHGSPVSRAEGAPCDPFAGDFAFESSLGGG